MPSNFEEGFLDICINGTMEDVISYKNSIDSGVISQDTLNHALLTTVQEGNFKVCDFLLENGADYKITNTSGSSLFNIAASAYLFGFEKDKSFLDICELILSIDPSYADSELMPNKPAIISSVEEGSYELLELLISKGANLNAQDQTGSTALHYAYYLVYPDFCLLLEDYGADTDIRDNEGLKPSDTNITQTETDIIGTAPVYMIAAPAA